MAQDPSLNQTTPPNLSCKLGISKGRLAVSCPPLMAAVIVAAIPFVVASDELDTTIAEVNDVESVKRIITEMAISMFTEV